MFEVSPAATAALLAAVRRDPDMCTVVCSVKYASAPERWCDQCHLRALVAHVEHYQAALAHCQDTLTKAEQALAVVSVVGLAPAKAPAAST